MLEVKIRKTKPIFKYLRSLKHKEYVTDLDVTDLTNITFAVIDKNGEKQDTISVKINIDIMAKKTHQNLGGQFPQVP